MRAREGDSARRRDTRPGADDLLVARLIEGAQGPGPPPHVRLRQCRLGAVVSSSSLATNSLQAVCHQAATRGRQCWRVGSGGMTSSCTAVAGSYTCTQTSTRVTVYCTFTFVRPGMHMERTRVPVPVPVNRIPTGVPVPVPYSCYQQ